MSTHDVDFLISERKTDISSGSRTLKDINIFHWIENHKFMVFMQSRTARLVAMGNAGDSRPHEEHFNVDGTSDLGPAVAS